MLRYCLRVLGAFI